MGVKDSGVDNMVFIGLCVVTWGVAYLIRVVISEAIRRAIVNQENR
jgi:hypothetical protein